METTTTDNQLLDERQIGVVLDAQGQHISLAHGGEVANNAGPLVDAGENGVSDVTIHYGGTSDHAGVAGVFRVDHVPVLKSGAWPSWPSARRSRSSKRDSSPTNREK